MFHFLVSFALAQLRLQLCLLPLKVILLLLELAHLEPEFLVHLLVALILVLELSQAVFEAALSFLELCDLFALAVGLGLVQPPLEKVEIIL